MDHGAHHQYQPHHPIGLPSGAVIPPGASVDVPEWDDIEDRKNLAFYVVTGVLVVDGGVQSDGQGGEEAYRQQLLAELKALGVNAGADSADRPWFRNWQRSRPRPRRPLTKRLRNKR